MPWATAAIIGGGSVVSGLLGSNAADDAARQQSDSAANAQQLQREMWTATRNDNAPFLQTGTAANKRLAALLGIGDEGPDSGSLLRKFSQADLEADPVYQNGLKFGADQGRDAINARATAGGMYDSGATLKALTRFGNDYGSTKANESFNRFNTVNDSTYNKFAGVSGAGQVATGQVGAANSNFANMGTQSIEGAGNARAAGIVGGANAWGNALTNIGGAVNNYQSNQRLNALIARSPSSGGGGAAVDPNNYYYG